eukprot:6669640-Prymnesium_polylepis.1
MNALSALGAVEEDGEDEHFIDGCTLIAKFGIPTTVSDRTEAPPAFPHAFYTMGKPKRSHEPPKAQKNTKNAC